MGVTVRRRARRARARTRPSAIAASQPELVRRAVDIMGAALLLVLTGPLLLGGMLLVALTGRPIFFGHERIGRNGVRFRCWKLRTMHPDAERALDHHPELYELYVSNGFKIPAGRDPRITRMGRWLRVTYIDELPQLVNVLEGSMSLFGPRPVIEQELRQYRKRVDELLRVKPGLLGEWTSLGRKRPSYPERARLELDYVANRSFRRDLRILLRAIPNLVAGQPR
jgi:lipopolysaccharide/colanic/teichoic acid biosynthesis glycosyltransferase